MSKARLGVGNDAAHSVQGTQPAGAEPGFEPGGAQGSVLLASALTGWAEGGS